MGEGARIYIRCGDGACATQTSEVVSLLSRCGCNALSPKVPASQLLDELVAGGYAQVRRLVLRDGHEGLVVDVRKTPSRRLYFQVVLCADKLRGMGLFPFDSQRSQAWYRLALKSHHIMKAELSAAQ